MTDPVFTPTRQVPDGGMVTWSQPDPNTPSDNHLAAAVPLQVIEETTGWAHIRCDNGWEAWVDASKLVAYVPPPFAATHHASSAGLETRESPDTAKPTTNRLAPGLPVIVVNRWGDWAKVRCENDWETWVDGRGLVAVSEAAHDAAGTGAVAAATPRAAASPLALWLPIAGAALAIIGGFLPWYKAGPVSSSAWDVPFATLFSHEVTNSGFDTGPVLLVLILAAIPLLTQRPLPRWSALALAAVATNVALLGFVLYLSFDKPRPNVGIGLILTLVGGIVMAMGVLMAPRNRPAARAS